MLNMSFSGIMFSVIFFYLIKFCGVFFLSCVEISLLGLGLDCYWMLVDCQGQFLIQCMYLVMVCIMFVFEGDVLVLCVFGMFVLQLVVVGQDGVMFVVKVWDSWVEVFDQGEQVCEWFFVYLQDDVCLVCFNLIVKCVCSICWIGEYCVIMQFLDGYLLLVIGQVLLDDFNVWFVVKGVLVLFMDCFCFNLVIVGWEVYEEDFIDIVCLGSEDCLV